MNLKSVSNRLDSKSISVCMAVLLLLSTARICVADNTRIPVASVNGVTIFQSDLSCAVEASLARRLSSRSSSSKRTESRRQPAGIKKTLNELISIELLYQESLKHRFHGLPAEAEQRYRKEVRRFGGEEELVSALECNNMTLEQFRKSIFRNLSIKRLLSEVVYSKIQVTESEIREFYELNKEKFLVPRSVMISQILIRVGKDEGRDKWRHAENKALKIYRHAQTGEDFLRLVKRHSDDPGSARSGGGLGVVHFAGPVQKDNQASVLDTVIFRLTEGTVTKPIRSQQGFHIFKVNSSKPPSTKKLEDVSQHISNLIRRKRAREMITHLLEDLKSKADIEIFQDSPQ